MRSFIFKRRSTSAMAGSTLVLATILLVTTMSLDAGAVDGARVNGPGDRPDRPERSERQAPEPESSTGLASYINAARQLLSSSLDAHNQARAYSSLMPNEDPRAAQMLRDTIDKTTDLIQSYQQEGLSNMPQLPNVPGLNTLMRLPDKLLRAELSMLQDGIRMAQEMRERPLMATMNTPKELTNMVTRMALQLSQ